MPKEANGQTRRQILMLLKQQGSTDAIHLAESLKVSAMAVRQHLYALQTDGLVTYHEQSRGMGRPAKLWGLTPAADAFFPEAYSDLTLSLLQSVIQAFGQEGLDRLLDVRTQQQIHDYQAHLGPGSLEEKVLGLSELRSCEGYMAEVQPQADGSWLLVENHCPICVAAQACTGLCDRELQVFRTVLGSTATVERAEHMVSGQRRCVYRITQQGSPDPG